jgi:hypothetical protein
MKSVQVASCYAALINLQQMICRMKSVQVASCYAALINLQQMICLDAGVVPVFHRRRRPMTLALAKRLPDFQSPHQLPFPNLPSHRAF